MCNFIRKNGKQCKLSKNKEICHVHSRMTTGRESRRLQDLSVGVPKSPQGSSIPYQSAGSMQIESSDTKLAAEILEEQVVQLKIDLKKAKNMIYHMKPDYERYQKVKHYEQQKNNLLKNKIDIYKYNNDCFHDLRRERNYIVHELILTK